MGRKQISSSTWYHEWCQVKQNYPEGSGIIQERERKVEVIGNLKMLWERDSDNKEDDAAVIDAEAKRVD